MSVMDVDFNVQFTEKQVSCENVGAHPHVHANLDAVGKDPGW